MRRARAPGALADPTRAQALLDTTTDQTEQPGQATGQPRKGTRRRSTALVLRISDLALLGITETGCIETGQRPGDAVLAETMAAWCGRHASDLTVLPVLDTDGTIPVHRAPPEPVCLT